MVKHKEMVVNGAKIYILRNTDMYNFEEKSTNYMEEILTIISNTHVVVIVDAWAEIKKPNIIVYIVCGVHILQPERHCDTQQLQQERKYRHGYRGANERIHLKTVERNDSELIDTTCRECGTV